MPPPTPGSAARSSAARASTDGTSELLATRLGLTGRIACLNSVLFWAIINADPTVLSAPTLLLTRPGNAHILGVGAAYGAMALATRLLPPQERLLRGIDLVAHVAICGLAALYGWETAPHGGSVLNGMLALTNVLFFRAALVPSHPGWSAVVGGVAVLPSVGLALVRGEASSADLPGMLGFVLGWSAMALIASVVLSGVIFGLARRARRAERLGQYQLQERIGAGSMGEVYRGAHARLQRPTAIKLLRPDAAGADAIARFEQEVQLTARLTHPNTIAIYDYGRTPDGVFYYAMELLDGVDLAELVRREGALPPTRVVHLLRQVCGSLAEAHEAGLVHRDVKAENVVVCRRGGMDDVVKVLDFGLARPVRGGAGDGRVAGTPAYLAPEAITHPATVDARADLYAVGVLAWVLLTGALPFRAETVEALLELQLHAPPPPPSARNPAVPPALEAVVLRCLEKHPDRRPQSARALSALLAQADPGEVAVAPAEAPPALAPADTFLLD